MIIMIVDTRRRAQASDALHLIACFVCLHLLGCFCGGFNISFGNKSSEDLVSAFAVSMKLPMSGAMKT